MNNQMAKKTLIKPVLSLLGMFLVYMLPSLSMGLVLPLALDMRGVEFVWLRDVLPLVAMCLAIFILWSWASKVELLSNVKPGLDAKSLAVVALLFVVVLYIIHLLGKYKGDLTANDSAIVQLFELFPLWLMLFFTCVVAPVCEEIIFRGMLMGRVFAKRVLLGAVVSTISFAMIHMPEDTISWLSYGLLGGLFAFVYARYRNLYLCMALHAFNNCLASLYLQG